MMNPRKIKFVKQFDKMDCGPACISMIASAYGKKYPLSFLRPLAGLTRDGVSVLGIRNALQKIGMDSATFEMTTQQLREKCPFPAILYWEQNHFVVICDAHYNKFKRKWQYKIANPAYGKATLGENDFERYWLNGLKGTVIAIEPNKSFSEFTFPIEKHSLLQFGKKYVWPYKLEMSQSAIGLLLGILISIISPFLTQVLVDEGIELRDMNIIVGIMVAQLLIFAGSFSMQLISSWVTLFMSTHINIDIIYDYLKKLLRLPLFFFETKSVGDYQQRLNDHNRLQDFMTYNSLQTIFSIASIPFYLIIIGMYSLPILCLYMLFTVFASLWMSYFFQRRKTLDYEQFKVSSLSQNKQFELLQGISDIKLNTYEDYKLEEWKKMQLKQYEMGQKSLKLNQIQNTGFTLIGQIRNILVTYWIATEVVNGNLTIGMMMSISTIIGQVNAPLSQIIGFLQQFQDAKISLERSQEVNLSLDEDSENQKQLPKYAPLDIDIKNLSFSYNGSVEEYVLSDIQLSIPAGKMTAIVGESGSGKTTLMKLLLKYYNPTKGEIFFGNENINFYTAKSIRQSCGIVMQDNFLFSDTIINNICLAEPIVDAKVKEVIKIACLEKFIERLPLGLQTKVGSEGIGISGGEKQRIMIARAIYKNPQYIFLDEATSSLDAENEHAITDSIDRFFSDRTRLVIAHRLSTVKNADKIIVMRKGKIVEIGTHIELIRKHGYYYELVQNQLELAE